MALVEVRRPIVSTDHLSTLATVTEKTTKLTVVATVVGAGLAALIDRSLRMAGERARFGAAVVLGMAVVTALSDKAVDVLHGNH